MQGNRRRGRPPHPDILTPAEWRVAHFVRHGLTNRQIAERFGVSLDAIKYHVANIVGKLGLDGRVALRRWRGAPYDSLLASRSPMEMENPTPIRNASTYSHLPIRRIGQISRPVRDLEQSVSWFRDVVGLTHLFTFGHLAFFDCGGVRLLLERSDQLEAASRIYFEVPDIDSAWEELGRRGAELLDAPHLIHRHDDGTEEWMAFFADPESRPLAIMSRLVPAEDPD